MYKWLYFVVWQLIMRALFHFSELSTCCSSHTVHLYFQLIHLIAVHWSIHGWVWLAVDSLPLSLSAPKGCLMLCHVVAVYSKHEIKHENKKRPRERERKRDRDRNATSCNPPYTPAIQHISASAHLLVYVWSVWCDSNGARMLFVFNLFFMQIRSGRTRIACTLSASVARVRRVRSIFPTCALPILDKMIYAIYII